MKPKNRKPETVAEALEFLEEIGAAHRKPRKFGAESAEFFTRGRELVFTLVPSAITRGRPVADGFAKLAAQRYATDNGLSPVIRFTGLEVEALVGPPVGAMTGGVRYIPTEKAKTPGLALCRALWSYLNSL